MDEKGEDTKEGTQKNNDQQGFVQDQHQLELQNIFGWIDSLDKHSLVKNLKSYNQNASGSVECLRKRLKNFLRRRKLTPDVKTLFPYYVIIDFEATCNEVNPPDYPHEIIEFPAVLVNTEKQTIVDHFQAFVKPVINPVLSPFCKTLTGISQEQVDNAPEFPEVLEQFEQWLSKHKLGTKNKFATVTDGPWDMGRFLYGQCMLSNIPFPNFAKKWINLRKCFSVFYKCERLRLQLMLDRLGLEFEGHPHCGLDDAKNIAHLLIRMIQDGAVVEINEKIQLRYKLNPRPNDENAANSSNKASKDSWPVKPLHTEAHLRTYSQALKVKHAEAEVVASHKTTDLKRQQSSS